MADEDEYERYWKTVRPNRRVSPPAPEEPPKQPDPRNYQGQQGQEVPLNVEHLRDLERLLSAEQLHPSSVTRAIQHERRVQELLDQVQVTRTAVASQHHSSWMNPGEGPPQLVNLVNAFTAIGIPVDVFLELQDDQHATSTLELILDRQTIRIESTNGVSTVRVFDRIDRL